MWPFDQIGKSQPTIASEVKDLAANRVRFNQTLDSVQRETGVNIPRLQKTNKGLGGIDDASLNKTIGALLSTQLDNEVKSPLLEAVNTMKSIDSSLDGTNAADRAFDADSLITNLDNQNTYVNQQIRQAGSRVRP